MMHPHDWREEQDPAYLFLRLWCSIRSEGRDLVANAHTAPASLATLLKAALSLPQGDAAVKGCCQAIEDLWDEGSTWSAKRQCVGLALCAMREIDQALLSIHPRSAIAASSSVAIPPWLEDVRDRRTLSGAYARTDNWSLIARGPFARSPKVSGEEATFVLTDQFAGVKVVDLAGFTQDGRALNVSIKVVDHSADFGVPARRDRAASEKVSFVPLAEASDDLVAKVTNDEARTFIDIVKGSAFTPAALMCEAITACADSDIVISPELTVEQSDVEAIADFLGTKTGIRPRLVVAGSGLIAADHTDSGYPYNQATMLNGNGTQLWSYSKVSAYAMHGDVAEGLTIPGRGDAKELMERISWSNEIIIADVDGLGRCLVLICQDLMMTAALSALLAEFRPDWVLVPILDSGTSLNRWPARQARDLATASEARFVIVSSLTMKAWSSKKYPGEEMGVAIGPAYVNKGDVGADRPAVEAEVSPESDKERYATLRWRSIIGWQSYR